MYIAINHFHLRCIRSLIVNQRIIHDIKMFWQVYTSMISLNTVDVDECHTSAINSRVCEQVCINTPGGYLCDCRNGFVLEGDSNCTGE